MNISYININKNNLKYLGTANRIVLTNTSKSIFVAGALYHKCCFYNFCPTWWASNKSIDNESEQNNSNDYTLLYRLVEHYIINKYDMYTVSQLCTFLSHILTTKIRSIDLLKNYKKNLKKM